MSEVTPFDEMQQALVDKLVGDARVKARERAKAEHGVQFAKAKEEAEQTKLAAEAKWKELAELHQARVKELEPFEAQAIAYGELVAGMLKDRIKELGDAAKKAVGALPEAMTAIEKLSWLNANEGLFQATGGGVGTPGLKKKPTPKLGKEVKISRFPIRL